MIFKGFSVAKSCLRLESASLRLGTLQWISNIPSRFFSIKLGEAVRLCKNVQWDLVFICNISMQLVSLKLPLNEHMFRVVAELVQFEFSIHEKSCQNDSLLLRFFLLCHPVWWEATLEALQMRPICQNPRRNKSLAA